MTLSLRRRSDDLDADVGKAVDVRVHDVAETRQAIAIWQALALS